MVEYSQAEFHTFVLILFRVSGFFIVAPFFGSDAIPTRVKVLLALLLTFVFRPYVDEVQIPSTALSYAIYTFNELAIGLFIGFTMMLFFSLVRVGGQLIDHELGLSLANVIDPVTQQQTSIIGQFKLIMAMLIFLLLDGHLTFLTIFIMAFKSVPVGEISMPMGLFKFISMDYMTALLKLSIVISAPVLITSVVTTISLGFMARAFPEFNFFAVGFSLRIMIIMVAYMLTVSVMMHGISNGLNTTTEALKQFILNWR